MFLLLMFTVRIGREDCLRKLTPRTRETKWGSKPTDLSHCGNLWENTTFNSHSVGQQLHPDTGGVTRRSYEAHMKFPSEIVPDI